VAFNSIGLTSTLPGGPPPAAIGNGRHGVFVAEGALGSNSVSSNAIANNGGAGIFAAGGRNAFLGNSVYSNGGLGIDLAPAGVNPNDGQLDPAKPNSWIDHPLVTGIYPGAASTVVTVSLSGVPANQIANVEIYLSPQADPSGYGEGAEKLTVAATRGAAGPNGERLFTFTVARQLPAGQFVTAIATRRDNNVSESSEFSPAVVVPLPDEIAPRVTRVYVQGGSWSEAFDQYLAAHSLGSAQFGYAIPDGAAQLNTLPWNAIRRVSVTFSEPVAVTDYELVARDASAVPYVVSAFEYDPATLTATWTLLTAGSLSDRILLDLNGDYLTGVSDVAGNPLDGDWADGADAYPSGDGTVGGSFRMTLNALTGDADRRGGRVNALDLAEVKRRLNSNSAEPVSGRYSPFADVDGSGAINALDLSAVRRTLNHELPPPPPAAAFAPAPPRDRDFAGITTALLSS
jgi:hypothetical protein